MPPKIRTSATISINISSLSVRNFFIGNLTRLITKPIPAGIKRIYAMALSNTDVSLNTIGTKSSSGIIGVKSFLVINIKVPVQMIKLKAIN